MAERSLSLNTISQQMVRQVLAISDGAGAVQVDYSIDNSSNAALTLEILFLWEVVAM